LEEAGSAFYGMEWKLSKIFVQFSSNHEWMLINEKKKLFRPTLGLTGTIKGINFCLLFLLASLPAFLLAFL
jgi:hypothetical protein